MACKDKKRNSRNETTDSAKISNDQLGENTDKTFSDNIAESRSSSGSKKEKERI